MDEGMRRALTDAFEAARVGPEMIRAQALRAALRAAGFDVVRTEARTIEPGDPDHPATRMRELVDEATADQFAAGGDAHAETYRRGYLAGADSRTASQVYDDAEKLPAKPDAD